MEIVTKIAPIILALIMLGLGLGLKFEDFTRVLKAPKDFFVGFVCQLIILPIIAYLLIIILRTPPEIAIGVMIIAAAPGGVTSNILTKFADGDVDGGDGDIDGGGDGDPDGGGGGDGDVDGRGGDGDADGGGDGEDDGG